MKGPEPEQNRGRVAEAPHVPEPVVAVVEVLQRAGFEAWVVGETLHDLLTGTPRAAYEIATSAATGEALALFDVAVPTHPVHGTVTVPTAAGPADLLPYRRGRTLEDDLRHREFTLLAIAWDPGAERLLDPHGGLEDLARGLLTSVGDAVERLFEDPVRALRAARLVASHGYRVAPELEAAIERVGPALMQSPADRKRRELVRLLLAPHAARGLGLLRRAQIERRLVRGVSADSAVLVEALPPVLEIRMAGWLRGTRPRALLRNLRFGLPRSQRIARLLDHHPLDDRVSPTKDRSLLRLLRVLPAEDLEGLFLMREWELGRRQSGAGGADRDGAHERLAAVRRAIERVQQNRQREALRAELALDGRRVMEILGCGPGRTVGTALRHLARRVEADPGLNTPEALREQLLAWARENPDRLPAAPAACSRSR